MGKLRIEALNDRVVPCPQCGGGKLHRILAEYETHERDDESDIQVWDQYRLVECRGCLTVSFQHCHQCTEDFDADGSLADTCEHYPAPPDELPDGAVVILITDIAQSTELTESLGDQGFRRLSKKLETELDHLVRVHQGVRAPGNVRGDGILALFRSARQALSCALYCRAAAEESGMKLHVGLHAGDVVKEKATVYGGAVNIASRIVDLSAPAEILVSDTVRGLARTSTRLRFKDRGEHVLKGVAEPVRVFALLDHDSGGSVLHVPLLAPT
jgi:class 3 adenylate cyclase